MGQTVSRNPPPGASFTRYRYPLPATRYALGARR